jgi:serine/threonine protein kinase
MESAMSEPARLGQYVLLRSLAVGGMGEVFLGRQRTALGAVDRLVAVKVLLRNYCENPQFVRMFVEEARLVAGLRHPGIVEVYDLGEQEGQYFLAMEYIAGCSLRDVLAAVREPGLAALPIDLACQMFADLAGALAHAHAGGGDPSRALIHRDVTPSNIMVSDAGAVKLIDFGVARAASRASLTTPGVLKGKFGYMAPEYIGGGAYDHRADIFSLGVVCYETLARRRLFRGRSAAEIIQHVMMRPIEPLDAVDPSIPHGVAEVVAQALARDPDDRYPTAAAFADALAAVAATLPPDPDTPTLRAWVAETFPAQVAARRALASEVMDQPLTAQERASISPSTRRDASLHAGATDDLPMHVESGGASQSLHGQKVTAASRPRRLSPIVLAAGAVLLLIAGGAGFVVSRSMKADEVTQRPSAGAQESPGSASGSTRTEAAAHRLLGLRAMQAKDHETAVRELTAAVRLGDPDATELLALATESLLDERRGARPPSGEPTSPSPPPPREAAPLPAASAKPERRRTPPRTQPRRALATTGPAVEDDAPEPEQGDDDEPSRVEPVRPSEPVTGLPPSSGPPPPPGPITPTITPELLPPVPPPPARPTPTPAPVVTERGSVCVTSPNAFGEVFIDGRGYGYPPLTARKIPAGEVRVEIRVDGAVRRSRTVTVRPGSACTEVRFD